MRGCRAGAGALALAAVVAAGCSAGGSEPSEPPAGRTGSTAVAAPAPTPTRPVGPGTQPTVWLCRPEMPDNPCTGGLDARVVRPDGSRAVERFRSAADPPVDCFYVYPTVSPARTANAPLRAGAAEVAAARAQAARFAAVCRLFAPVYRQVTRFGLATGKFTDRAARDLAHGDVVSAWHDYLRTAGQGRRFVLIGHSQGAFALIRLVQEEIDGDPALRARLVSALLIGGHIGVPAGKDVGGDFRNVPACRRPDQTGCVVAYNSFDTRPPADSLFGRSGGGRDALCVNPAALAGGRARLRPYLPVGGAGFVTFPGLTAECRRAGGLTWLQVDGLRTAPVAAVRDAVRGLGPAWGLHRGDVNLALGDLVDLVRAQSG